MNACESNVKANLMYELVQVDPMSNASNGVKFLEANL